MTLGINRTHTKATAVSPALYSPSPLPASQHPNVRANSNPSTYSTHTSVGLSDLSSIVSGLPKLKEGYQDCPFCKRPKKLRVTGDQHYKCFHPECGKSGSVYDFLIQMGRAKSFQEAATVLGSNYSKSSKKDWFRRMTTLTTAFELYEVAITDECLSYLNDRGYGEVLESQRFGYAPDGGYLQERGMRLADLVEVGLAYQTGQEFYRNRVVFPVCDREGRIVHFQGRSLDADAEVRWLATPSRSDQSEIAISPITHYLYNAHSYLRTEEEIDVLFLQEGVSDCLSMLQLGVKAVACFGVEVSLVRHTALFEKVKHLFVMLDGDRYAVGTPKAGLYKSWTPMLSHLVDLKKSLPNLEIWCAPPPNQPGIKDINNWLRSGLLTPTSLESYLRENAKRLEVFATENLGDHWQFHPLLATLVGVKSYPEDIERLREYAAKLEPDPIKYAIELIKYV